MTLWSKSSRKGKPYEGYTEETSGYRVLTWTEENSLSVVFYDISPDGEEIPWPGQSDNRPAKEVLRVRFDYRGANGAEQWKERLAEFGATGEALKRSRDGRKRFAESSKPTEG